MLKVSGLHKSFLDGEEEVKVLVDVSFSLPKGESLAITGPSGSGKSTLLNLLAGVISPDGGSIELQLGADTVALQNLTARAATALRRKHIGYVHQFFNLIPTLTVLENLLLPARLNKVVDANDKAHDLLRRIDLEQKPGAFPEMLSGGQQQRVAVARALICQPEVILADEPTGNLDQENAQRVSDLLFSACLAQNTSLVVATHSAAIAEVADQQLSLVLVQ